MSTVLLGIFVVRKHISRETSWYFGLFTLGTALWSLSLFMAISQLGQPTLWGRLAISFGSFMPAGFFIFIAAFPTRSRFFPTERLVVGILSTFFFAISLSPLVVKEAWIVGGQHIAGNLGPWYLPFWCYYLLSLIAAFFRVATKYRASDACPARDQLRYILLGFLTFFVPLLVTQFILPLFSVFKYNNLGPLFSLPMIGIIGYAIVRHELLDIRIVIQRGVVYTILSAIIIGLYIIGLELSVYFLPILTEESAVISAGITTTAGVFFLRPLETYLRKRTDHIFFKNPYNYAEALHTLGRVLQTSLNRDDILATSAENLGKIFKTSDVTFVLEPSIVDCLTEREQAEGFSTITQPIMFDERPLGFLRLGQKRSGDRYSKQDKQLLATFAAHAAIALSKADLHAEVQRYSMHLESLVEERTREVTRMQEGQKQTMIDISHNLQTPLAIIRGEIEMIGETADTPERFETLRNSIDRVSGFIRQLLHLARLEHSIYTIEHKPTCLSKLMREQVEYFEVMAEQEGVRIETSVEPDCGIMGDKRLLEELFVNLVTNAIAYRDKNRQSIIRIQLQKRSGIVSASVSDNGIGIAEKDLSEIFHRFYRVPNPEHPLQGTGLGLAIVKNIAEKHGAELSVTSTFGTGTTFTVEFPLVEPSN